MKPEAFVASGALDAQQCDRLIELFHELHDRQVSDAGSSGRISNVYLGGWPDLQKEYGWTEPAGTADIPMRLAGAVFMVNGCEFGFWLLPGNCLTKLFIIDRQQAGTGSMRWHSDNEFAARAKGFEPKLVLNVQLSEPGDYDGGELELYDGKRVVQAPRERGDLVLHPAFTLHRRLPVTGGCRYVLLSQAFGPRFR